MKKIIILILLGVTLLVRQTVIAVKQDKVTICHRTDAANNPYVQNEVAADSADGDTGNDNGQGDHSEHTGPVATSEAVAQGFKDADQKWGDIIPPHNNFVGLNWTAEGQAIYNNGCNYVVITPTLNISATPELTPTSGVQPTVNPTLTPTVIIPTGIKPTGVQPTSTPKAGEPLPQGAYQPALHGQGNPELGGIK